MHGHSRDTDTDDEDTQICRFCDCAYCTCCGCSCDRRDFYDSLRYRGHGDEDADAYVLSLHDDDVNTFHRMYINSQMTPNFITRKG